MPPKKTGITLIDLDKAPEDLPGAPVQMKPDEVEKLQRRFAEISEEHQSLRLEYDEFKRQMHGEDELNKLIKPMAQNTFRFMCFYCGVVGFILIANALNMFSNRIDDGVLKVLVGSTAATVIGLVGMVLTGVFVGVRKKK